MTNPPTLTEMRHALGEVAPSGSDDEPELTPPTFSEMRHILETQDDVLEHFGIKGMKWGVRRSPKQLASVRNSDGDEVSTISSASRKVKDKIKNMKAGQVALLDTDDGPMITVKQKDGSFREVKLSADQEGVLRTMRKDPSEMSTRELKEATARAQALEQYNKLFNPADNPNKELEARVQAMKLQMDYSKMHSQMNPSRIKRASQFINDLQPAFSAFKTADKALNGALTNNIKDVLNAMNTPAPAKSKASKSAASSQAKRSRDAFNDAVKSDRKRKKTDDYVYDITTMGKDDFMNPFVPALEPRRS